MYVSALTHISMHIELSLSPISRTVGSDRDGRGSATPEFEFAGQSDEEILELAEETLRIADQLA